MPTPDLRDLLAFATEAAFAAGQLTLAHFQTGVDVEEKADESPVTVADRGAEQLLRRRIEARFPDHAILGEEMGESPRAASFRWIIDPIDGTRSFIRGVPLYGVLMGLEHEGELVLGVAHFPALGETVAAATGRGCWWNGRPARVSTVARMERALVSCTDEPDFDRHGLGEPWRRLRSAAHTVRGWGDCYGHVLVATGRAEVMADAVLKPWDCAAIIPILREAGGTFINFEGETSIHGPGGLSINGALEQQVRELILR